MIIFLSDQNMQIRRFFKITCFDLEFAECWKLILTCHVREKYDFQGVRGY